MHIKFRKNEARPLPKYKQRQMKIDAAFEELGTTLADWKQGAWDALLKMNLPSDTHMGLHPEEDFLNPRGLQANPEFLYWHPESDKWPKPKGTICGVFHVTVDLDAMQIVISANVYEAGDTYYPGGSLRQRSQTLWENNYAPIPITANPEDDVAAIAKISKEYEATFEKVSAERGAMKEKSPFNWADVRRVIDARSVWDVYDGDRPDITAYLVVGDEIPIALYAENGKVIHMKDLLTRSTRFSKIEVVPVEGFSKEDADEYNAKLADCKTDDDIAKVFLSLK